MRKRTRKPRPESLRSFGVTCACWRNPETGYLEACPKHEGEFMDQMMKKETASRETRGALPDYVIVSDGEGAEACVIANKELHQAVHDFMCVCGKNWRECDSDCTWDCEQLDKPDEWTKDEDGRPFSMAWPHETGKITLYRMSASRDSALSAERAAAEEMRKALERIAASNCTCVNTADPNWHSPRCMKGMAESALRTWEERRK